MFLSELFHPHGSGAELATRLYAELLSNADVSVNVVTNRFAGESAVTKNGSLTIHRLPMFKNGDTIKYSVLTRFDVLFSSFLREMIKKADVVYVPRFWFSAILLAKAQRKPVISHLHDYIPVCSLSNVYNETKAENCTRQTPFCSPECIYSFEKAHERNLKQTITSIVLNTSIGRYIPKLVKLADAVVCVSKKQMEIVGEKDQSLRDKMNVIYNPFPDFSDIDLTCNDFGYFGGSDVLKGFRILAKALMRLKGRSAKPIHVHATKFKGYENSYVNELKDLGLVLHGKLEDAEFERVYRSVSCVLVPSLWHEPLPYVVTEALVRRRFVIASRVGGISEQVDGCKGAILLSPGDYEGLSNSLEYVSSLSKDEILNFGSQNRETFLRRFNNDSSIKTFIKLCEKIL